MKQFLYLDTDIVTSIIAQAEKGYVTQQVSERESGSENQKQKEKGADIKASASGGFFKMLQVGVDTSITGTLRDADSRRTSTKDVAEKILHDAAFDMAFDYIGPIQVETNDQSNDEEGNYIKISRCFDFVDFKYLEKLFDKNGIIDFIKKEAAEAAEVEINKAREGHNRSELRNAGVNIKLEIKKAIAESNQQYDDIGKIIHAFRGLMPYDRLLISHDGYLVPLDDKYFRINPSNLGFKYGGQMTCVGMVTNIIGESTDPNNEDNIFATIQFTVNEALRSMLPTTKKDLCVLHPIALYYGE